ncbi:MAG: TIGR02147 family protein [Bdellovibrionota bacterium]|nr:TIGR02147 family protein [Bdellovibrionota bacterium]
MHSETEKTYRDILMDELRRRKALNESYSLRAFAKYLELSASRLSQILNEKEGLSYGKAQELVKKLKLSDKEEQIFCLSVGALHSRKHAEKEAFSHRLGEIKKSNEKYEQIGLEYFQVISDWYHFAILELTRLDDFHNDEEWIANRLGIKKEEVKLAIARMKNLKLLEEKDGKLIDNFQYLVTPQDTPSVALKKFNSQLMKKAMLALFEQDVDQREIASTILTIDREELPAIKKLIRDFRKSLERNLKSKRKNAVYCLNTQFFDLTEGESK